MATINMAEKRTGCCAPFAGELGPRLTQCDLGRGLLPYMWRLHPSSPLATIDMGGKLGAVPLWGAESLSTTMSPGPRAYLRTKWHLDPSSRLITIDMGRYWGGLCPLFGIEELGPYLAQCGPPPCQVPC